LRPHLRLRQALPKALPCPRFPAGSSISQPQDLFSEHGVLRVNFTYETRVDPNGNTLFCFMTESGAESPTLHVRPGDRLLINLKNNVPAHRIHADGRDAGDDRFGKSIQHVRRRDDDGILRSTSTTTARTRLRRAIRTK
jgi:hypothetical protein